jgi:hypothetical protein
MIKNVHFFFTHPGSRGQNAPDPDQQHCLWATYAQNARNLMAVRFYCQRHTTLGNLFFHTTFRYHGLALRTNFAKVMFYSIHITGMNCR